jgi:ribosomal-protein-alanine N-acetyltransferase
MQLETERLSIRPIRLSDKQAVFKYRSDPSTAQYLSTTPTSIEDVADFIRKSSTEINIAGSWFQFVLIDKKSESLIGDIGLHFIDNTNESKQVELGYTLSKLFRGKGYATEALKCIIDYLFDTLNKHRVFASIDPINKDSIALIERLGFRKEAHFVKSLFFHGKWVDDVVYAITKTEWKSSKNALKSKDFPILKTSRFTLRQFNRNDLENVFCGLSDQKVTAYYGVSFDTLEATKEQMEWFKDLEKNKTGIWWAICTKKEAAFVGAVGLNNVEKDHKKAEVGCWLLPKYWGKGIMVETMPIICDYGFKNLELHRIEGFVESANTKCKNAMAKLDFQHEGTMRACEVKNGRFISLDIYAKINNTSNRFFSMKK